jgi:hypothetical protein
VKNKITLVASLILGLFFVLIISSLENKKSNSLINKKPQQENNFVVEISNKIDESKIYETAYQRGYNSFMMQFGRTDLVSNKKIEAYTSNVTKELSEEEKQKIEEISDKAYVDGYHKASDSFVCPR